VYAYGLMNEPHDLLAVAGGFSGTVRYPWASTVEGWTGDSATASATWRQAAAVGDAGLGLGQHAQGRRRHRGRRVDADGERCCAPRPPGVAAGGHVDGEDPVAELSSFTYQDPTSTWS
jgi:hypothetical protein